jgi:hypothetical protein
MENHHDGRRCSGSGVARAARLVFLTGLLAALPLSAAEPWEFGGHLKVQYSATDFRTNDLAAAYGEDPAHDQSLDARLKASWRAGGWDFSAHYELLGVGGDSLETRRALAAAGLLTIGTVTGLPNDKHRLFDLTDELSDGNRVAAVQRLDRLALGYSSGNATLRFGRQAVSWGNGLAFQVLDFVNPFSPIAVDKDYKTGEDMLYGQWMLAAGADAQLMLLPRRDPLTHDLDHERASQALKLHARTGAFDVDALVARHYDQTLLGLGLVRSVGGAVWRFDTLHTEVPRRDGVWSFVTNLDYSWTLLGKNMYGFVEYFRNGFGGAREGDYLVPDPELAARLARGELYSVGRDYAALGVQIELAPLVNLFGNLINNLNDASRIVQFRGVWDARQNLAVMAGANVPVGGRGSEYGGIPTPLPGIYAAPGRSLFLRAAWYF